MYKNYASWKPSTVQGSIDNSNYIPEKSFITQTDTNLNSFPTELFFGMKICCVTNLSIQI